MTPLSIDGLAAAQPNQLRAISRRGHDWTAPYRRVVEAWAKLGCWSALLDGEIVLQDEHSLSDFHALRSAIHTAPHRLVFFAFDLLHLDIHEGAG
jgi:bifunctional non-homologous end joining protein LigD